MEIKTEMDLDEEFLNNENVPMIHVEEKVLDLYLEWGLCGESISLLTECGIQSIEILSIMHSHDIDEVFNKRKFLGEKIKFRYKLQKWRMENKYPLVICCDSAQSLPTTTCSSSPPPPHQEPEITPAPSAFTAVDIKNILSKTIVGTDIISKYKTNKSLEESDQTAIAKIVVDDLFLNGVKMDPKVMKKVADAIVDLFPTENSLMYYTPRTAKRTPSGKLYSRYFNMIYKRKQASDGSSQAKKIRNVEPSADTLHHNEEYMSMKVWLSENIPENLMAVWKETSKYRMNDRMDLEKMLDEWPRYKDPNGPELINIDFENLYEGKGNNMFRKMEDFEKQFDEDFFVSQIKDKQNLQYLTRLKSVELPLDSKHVYFFYLLNVVIQPPRINKTLKPSILDAQNDMIVHLVSLDDFKQKEDELKELATKEGLKLLPKIFVVGESISNLTEFYVYLNGILYKMKSVLSAADLIIKISLVFKIEFSAKSRYVWMFLQEYFYEIPLPEKIPKIINVLSKLHK